MTSFRRIHTALAGIALALGAVAFAAPNAAQATTPVGCVPNRVTFPPFSSSDGVVRTILSESGCENDGVWNLAVKVQVFDTACDSRAARFTYRVYDEFGQIGQVPFTSWGGGCNTNHTFGPYHYSAYTSHQSLALTEQACNSTGCSTPYSRNFDWWN
jgi:hypothetical protein